MPSQSLVPADPFQGKDLRTKEATGNHTLLAMRSRLDDANFQARGCSIIADWNINAVKVSEFGEAAAHLCVIAAMNAHPSNSELQQFGCSALANICENAPNVRDAVGEDGAVSVVCSAMQTHPRNPQVQHRACRALIGLAPVHAAALAEQSAHRRALVAMRQHQADSEVQKWCSDLIQILAGDETCLELLFESEAHVAVIDSLNAHCTAPAVQAAGSRALRALIAHKGCRQVIKTQGGCSAVLKGMLSNPDYAAVAHNGASLLSSLVGDCAEICAGLVAEGAVRTIVEAMQQHGTDPELERHCWHALVLLASQEPERELMLCVLSAMKGFGEEAPLMRHGCDALYDMVAAGGLLSQRQAVRAGAHTVVLAAMRSLAVDSALQIAGCRVLGALAAQAWEEQVTLVSDGAAETVLAALVGHPDNAELAVLSCDCLASLAEHQNQKRRVCASADAPLVLQGVFKAHGDHHDAVVAACQVVNVLAAEPANTDALLARGLHQLVSETVGDGKHRFSIAAAVAACDAMTSLCRREPQKVAPQMVLVAAHDSALSMLRIHRESPAVVRSALWAIGLMAVAEGGVHKGALHQHMEVFGNLQHTREGTSLRVVAAAQAYLTQESCPHAVGVSREQAPPSHDELGSIQHAVMVAIAGLARSVSGAQDLIKEGALAVIVSAMAEHPLNHPVCEKGCHALYALSTNGGDIQALIDAGAMQAVVHAMTRFSSDVVLQHRGLVALVSMATDEASCAVLLKEGAVGVVLEAMSTHPSDSEVQFAACMVVVAMSKLKDFCESFAADGGIDAVLSATKKHQDNADVMDQCWWALVVLALVPENVEEVVSKKGHVAVLQRMGEQQMDEGVQQFGCNVLGTLACGGEQIKQMLLEVGSHAAVAGAMKIHSTSESVTVHGCLALQHLYTGTPHPLRGDEYHEGVRAIAAAMQLHMQSVEVQAAACAALAQFASIDTKTCQLVADHGTVPHAVIAMEAFASNAQMQLAALKFATAVSGVDQGRIDWSHYHGLPAIYECLLNHSTDCQLVEASFDAVAAVCADGISQVHFMQLGIHATTTDLLNNNIESAPVQAAGMRLLAVLAQTQSNLQPLLTSGALECALNALQAHKNGDTAQVACAAVAALLPTSDSESIPRGAEQAVLDVMRLHLESAAVQQHGADALAACAARGAASPDGVQRLVAAVLAHPEAPAVQRACLHALDQHCTIQWLCKDVCAAGAFKLVALTMKDLIEDDTVIVAGCRMLESFLNSTGHSAGKQLVVDSGAVEAVVDGMCHHWDHAEVQAHGASVLAQLGALVDDKSLARVGMSKRNSEAQRGGNGLLPW